MSPHAAAIQQPSCALYSRLSFCPCCAADWCVGLSTGVLSGLLECLVARLCCEPLVNSGGET